MHGGPGIQAHSYGQRASAVMRPADGVESKIADELASEAQIDSVQKTLPRVRWREVPAEWPWQMVWKRRRRFILDGAGASGEEYRAAVVMALVPRVRFRVEAHRHEFRATPLAVLSQWFS